MDETSAQAASAKQRVLQELQRIRARVQELEGQRTEPVAIIGMGCRFPGAASPGDLWRLLQRGAHAIVEVPSDRWDVDAYYDPDATAPGKTYSRRGGFIEGMDKFDAAFFGISHLEAQGMDPQQRLLLEVSWEALENAGQRPSGLSGSETGVFFGVSSRDHQQLLDRVQDLEQINAYTGTGGAFSVASGRLSYVLGLQGPSISLDTACSSSLVAVHLACHSLRERECTLALAGGVNVVVVPNNTIAFSKTQMLSPDGLCKTFDASANGYVRGEGCGVVVLKRLSQALEQGDTVLAVIRGSAVNQDGPSTALTAPNGPAQQTVIRRAMAGGKVESGQIAYVECHGTGTTLGDPIEVQALGGALGEARAGQQQLAIGSIKTNLGHLETAAGVAGLMKVVLAMQHEEIPPHLHLRELNPYLSFDASHFVVPTGGTPWPAGPVRRLAGVSSFGFSGTNAHLVLEDVPREENAPAAMDRPEHLLTISAKNADGLKDLAARYASYLETASPSSLADICYTAGTGRAHFDHRLAARAASTQELKDKLVSYGQGLEVVGLAVGARESGAGEKLAFLFPGQGAQYVGMGRALYESQPVFREALDRCAGLAATVLDAPLLQTIWGEGAKLEDPAHGHVALFSIEHALSVALQSWGVVPAAVFGHGVGEYVAACLAGVMKLEDALRLAAERGRVVRALAQGGAAEPLLDALEKLASQAQLSTPRLTMIAGLSGGAAGKELTDPKYWRRQAQEPSLFQDGVQHLYQSGLRLFLEVGPGPALAAAARRCSPRPEGLWLPLLRRGADEWRQVLDALAALYVRGVEPDWSAFDRGHPRRRASVPCYPFRQRRCWPENAELAFRGGGPLAGAAKGRDQHPLLGQSVETESLHIFESRLTAGYPRWANDHRAHGVVVFPFVAYLETILSAAKTVFGPGAKRLDEVVVQEPLVLEEGKTRLYQVIIARTGADEATFEILSRSEEDTRKAKWSKHASGKLVLSTESETPAADGPHSLRAIQGRCQNEEAIETFYAASRGSGLQLGQSFQVIRDLRWTEGEALAQLRLGEGAVPEAGIYQIAPPFFDGCFQMCVQATRGSHVPAGELYLPVAFDSFHYYQRPEQKMWCAVTLRKGDSSSKESYKVDARAFDDEGRPLFEIRGLNWKRAPREALLRLAQKDSGDLFYRIEWRPQKAETPQVSAEAGEDKGTWVVLSDESETARELLRALDQRGERCVTVTVGDGCSELGDREYRVNPIDVNAVGELVKRIHALNGPAWRGVLHLWGLGSSPTSSATGESLRLDQARSCGSVLHLVQKLIELRAKTPPRLCLVTRGAQKVLQPDGALLAVAQAPLWGLGRVVRLEHPELRCLTVDLDPSMPGDGVSSLLSELSAYAEDEVAFRGPERYVRRMVRRPSKPGELPARTLGPEHQYLITGGLGGLGLLIARWMVMRGARHIALVDLHEPSESAQAAVQEIRGTGAQVSVLQTDITRCEEVGETLRKLAQSGPALRGVIHAAGVLADGVLINQDWGKFSRVLSPKVEGAWNLHLATLKAELDFFVLFSSQASLWGNSGQGNYAAANSFLDTLAHYRRAQGLAAVSVNWGPWSGAGMAAGVARRPGGS